MTDADLIKNYLDGHINAFNTLVWRWQKPIYNFILKNVGHRETAQDLSQSTFIKVYKQLRKLKDPEKFAPWIYRIALNVCRDEFKKKKNRHMISIDTMPNEEESQAWIQLADTHQTAPDTQMENIQLSAILKRALHTLPEEQRVIVVMKQYQGLKFTEIADILNESVNTVKSRLYYGLRAMRKYLETSQYNREVLTHEM